MATKFAHTHIEATPPQRRRRHLRVVPQEVTADDMRREHEEALRSGPGHPGYQHARCHLMSAKNASDNFGEGTVEELLQITFEALAETRNRHPMPS